MPVGVILNIPTNPTPAVLEVWIKPNPFSRLANW
jgi:hypothetical protein